METDEQKVRKLSSQLSRARSPLSNPRRGNVSQRRSARRFSHTRSLSSRNLSIRLRSRATHGSTDAEEGEAVEEDEVGELAELDRTNGRSGSSTRVHSCMLCRS